MQDENTTPAPVPGPARPRRRFGAAAGLIAAGAIAGGVLAGSMSASAADDTSGSSTSTASPSSSSTGAPDEGKGGAKSDVDRHSSSPIRGDETALTGDLAEQVKAAALKEYPGGTVYRTETDSGPAEYEAHMTKADGTDITVLFDKDVNVTGTEAGGGGKGGGPGGGGQAGGPGGGGPGGRGHGGPGDATQTPGAEVAPSATAAS